MPDRVPFRASDVVIHNPTRERWVLACDEDESGYVYPAGWPQSRVPAADCDLVKAATDSQRIQMLHQVVEQSDPGSRRATARDQLRAADPEYDCQKAGEELDAIGDRIAADVVHIARLKDRHGRDFVLARKHGPLLDAVDTDGYTRGDTDERERMRDASDAIHEKIQVVMVLLCGEETPDELAGAYELLEEADNMLSRLLRALGPPGAADAAEADRCQVPCCECEDPALNGRVDGICDSCGREVVKKSAASDRSKPQPDVYECWAWLAHRSKDPRTCEQLTWDIYDAIFAKGKAEGRAAEIADVIDTLEHPPGFIGADSPLAKSVRSLIAHLRRGGHHR